MQEIAITPITLTETETAVTADTRLWGRKIVFALDSGASGKCTIKVGDAGSRVITKTLIAGETYTVQPDRFSAERGETLQLSQYAVLTDASGAAEADQLYVTYQV